MASSSPLITALIFEDSILLIVLKFLHEMLFFVDLGKRASSPSHINEQKFYQGVGISRYLGLTGLVHLHINRPEGP